MDEWVQGWKETQEIWDKILASGTRPPLLAKLEPSSHLCLFFSSKQIFYPHIQLGFPDDGSAGKESACNVGELGSIPGLGRSPREGKDYPLQYSGLKNSMDCIVHGVTENQTQLSNFHFYIQSLSSVSPSSKIYQESTPSFVSPHCPLELSFQTCLKSASSSVFFISRMKFKLLSLKDSASWSWLCMQGIWSSSLNSK